MKKAVNNAKAAVEREKAKRTQQAVQRDQAALQDAASTAAAKIKEPEKQMMPLYQIPQETQLTQVPEHVQGAAIDLTRPLAFRAPLRVDEFRNLAKVQLMIGNFGGQYKKSQQYKDTGCYQQPIYKDFVHIYMYISAHGA